ncbi:unnamed protein product [Rotaria sordida]|uniref:F-box domain-containing protein n=1 Tax=Rotaria sordida TaxID=392033 RepID=A0A815MGG3_9BILA|nr:unnamed protein product [Rotaria sordida]
MNILSSNDIHILDLPDEMLRAIFNKLNMADMLYSLVDVNQRFDRLALDSLYIYHLDFSIEAFNNYNSSTYTHILDRICSKILPRINQKVTKLTVDPLSMERILGAIDYSQLHSLSFVNFEPKILSRHLTDKTMLHLLANQITHITVDINIEKTEISNESEPNIFEFILLYSTCLNDLTFFQKSSREYLAISSLNIPYGNSLSLSLIKLKINVNTFDDCLYLLNGCLPSLSTLIIRIKKIARSTLMINNTKELFKLKCFLLSTNRYTFDYDKQVVPLLCRMLNLEELTLFVSVIRTKSTYIDGNQLYDKVLNYMPRLNKFIFSIHTHISNEYSKKKIDLPSNNDIRNSFTKRGIQSIDIFADDKLINNRGNCHVYSLPYQFNDFLFMNSCFQGGRFDKVRLLSMDDIRPFEHELFQIISQDFPFLRTLIILNNIPQKNKQHHSSTLITFNHLFELDLFCVHNDYVIQFLSDKNTRLPCLTNLIIRYETLLIVTNNFTNNATRLNCSKIKSLVTHKLFVGSQDYHSYFPSLSLSTLVNCDYPKSFIDGNESNPPATLDYKTLLTMATQILSLLDQPTIKRQPLTIMNNDSINLTSHVNIPTTKSITFKENLSTILTDSIIEEIHHSDGRIRCIRSDLPK